MKSKTWSPSSGPNRLAIAVKELVRQWTQVLALIAIIVALLVIIRNL